MALAIAWIAFSATFSGIGLYFGSEMENSLVLFYGAPVAFTLVDCAWFFIILPRSRRSVWTFACVGTLNVLLCLPILLLFVPTVTGAILTQVVPSTLEGTALLWVHDISVPVLVESLFVGTLGTLLPWMLRQAGLLGVSVLESTELHLICVFEASLVMGTFDDPMMVIGVILIVSAFFTVQRLRDAYQDGDPDELYLSWCLSQHTRKLAFPCAALPHPHRHTGWATSPGWPRQSSTSSTPPSSARTSTRTTTSSTAAPPASTGSSRSGSWSSCCSCGWRSCSSSCSTA